MSRPISNDPIPVRVPGRILTSDLWLEGARTADDAPAQVRDLTVYRLNRLEAEVLAPGRIPGRPEQRLRRMISAYVKLAITDPGVMNLIPEARKEDGNGTGSPEERRRVQRFTDTLERRMAEAMEAQARAPSIDSQVAVQSLLGILHWGVCSHRAEARLTPDEAAAQITFLALHGLVAEPPAAMPTRRRGLPAA